MTPMRCKCGETEVEYLLATTTVEQFPDEVGYFHAAPRCTWAFECHDCLGFNWAALVPGFASRDEAIAGLEEHLQRRCPVNVRPQDYVSPQKRPRFIPFQEAQ